jgi:hypothetical protein
MPDDWLCCRISRWRLTADKLNETGQKSVDVPLLAAEPDIGRLAMLRGRLHLASLGIRRDREIPRRAVAENLGFAVRTGEQEDPLLRVVRQCEGSRRRRGRASRVSRQLSAAGGIRNRDQTSIVERIGRPYRDGESSIIADSPREVARKEIENRSDPLDRSDPLEKQTTKVHPQDVVPTRSANLETSAGGQVTRSS